MYLDARQSSISLYGIVILFRSSNKSNCYMVNNRNSLSLNGVG